VAGDHRLLNSQSVEQTHDIANVMEYGVLLHLLRSVASDIAMEVGRHRAEPALRERPKLMPPRIPALGKAVAEDDRAATDMSGLQPLRHNSDFTIAMSGAGHWGATLARSDSRAKDGMDNAAGLLAGFLVLALSLAIYFIPTLVAFERLRRNRGAIFGSSGGAIRELGRPSCAFSSMTEAAAMQLDRTSCHWHHCQRHGQARRRSSFERMYLFDLRHPRTEVRLTCMGLFLSSSRFGLFPVLCWERKGRSSSRRLGSGSRSARKGSRDRNASQGLAACRLAALVFRSALTPEHAER
jgi:hypothetical protein